MVYHVLSIETPSARVLGKLRKGKKVRIMKGTGMCLVVHPSRFNPITRSFNKGKAHTLELTQQEIAINKNPHAEELVSIDEDYGEDMEKMFGKGLFDDIRGGFERFGRAAAPVADKAGRVLLPVAKQIAKEGLNQLAEQAPDIGAAALTGLALYAGQPELVPFAQQVGRQGGKALGDLARDEGGKQIDSYNPYEPRRPRREPRMDPREPRMEPSMPEEYDLPLPPRRNQPPSRGTATNPLTVKPKSLADYSVDELGMEIARRRGGYSSPLDTSGGKRVLAPYTSAVGQGLGSGLYAQSRGRGIEKSSVSILGNLVRGGSLPPALQSQPYASNFQMASRLPPQYAQLIKSG